MDPKIPDYTGTPVATVDPQPTAGLPTSPPFFIQPPGVDFAVTDRFRTYPSRDLTPQKLTNILEEADLGWYYEYAQLCEEVLEKDPKIGSVFHTRTAAVLGTYHEINPVELDTIREEETQLATEISQFVNTTLQNTNTDEMIGDLLDSIGKGLAVDWIIWGEDAKGMWVPKRFKKIPLTHLRWSQMDETVRVYNPSGINQMSMGDYGVPLPPLVTVRALNNERRDHPARAGLLRSLLWYYLFKNIAVKDWVSFGDRYGMPMRVIKLPDADFRNPDMYNAARAALRDMGTDASGVVSMNADLNIVAANYTNANVFRSIVDYFDTAFGQVVLGHELSSQGSRGQGNLGISVAQQVRQDILEGDCTFMSEVIRRDIIVPMVGFNYGWEKVHLAPRLLFDFEPPKDLVAQANILAVISQVFPSLKFSEQQIRDMYGYDAPLENYPEDTLMPAKAPVQKVSTPEKGTPEVSMGGISQ